MAGDLFLLRHGKSVWNKLNLFTGWVNIPLAEEGVEEALKAGEELKEYRFDALFTSELIRAQMTVLLALSKNTYGQIPVLYREGEAGPEEWQKVHSEKAMDKMVPMFQSRALNERYYGELQGKNKEEILQEVGEEQFKLWRRSYDVPPPEGESLKDTIARTLPYFEAKIAPRVKKGETILVGAHGNSIRGIVKEIEGLSDEEITKREIATGEPLHYQFVAGKWEKAKVGLSK